MSGSKSFASPDTPTNWFRRRRFVRFKKIVEEIIVEKGHCRVLDIGGTEGYWRDNGQGLDWAKVEVVIVNLKLTRPENPRISSKVGDARDLSEFEDFSFDLVHSNSVLEHVGLYPDQMKMVAEVHRLAPRHFIQTPNYWFPLEPHCHTLFLHWLPEPIAVFLVRHFQLGYWPKAKTYAEATILVQCAILLTSGQMRELFPSSEIMRERFLGVTKSFVAIK